MNKHNETPKNPYKVVNLKDLTMGTKYYVKNGKGWYADKVRPQMSAESDYEYSNYKRVLRSYVLRGILYI